MIYNLKKIEAPIVSEGTEEIDFDTLMENTENRFEFESIAEAAAIVVNEQEANWKRFMEAVGFAELSTVMEGQEVIYEAGRLSGFLTKAKEFFEGALKKLGEITKSFIDKVRERIGITALFLKKYEKELSGNSSSVKIKGYAFNNEALNKAGGVYKLTGVSTVSPTNAKDIIDKKDSDFTKKAAQKDICPDASDDKAFVVAARDYLFGEKKELEVKVSDELAILKKTKGLQDDAKKSYSSASKEIKSIISNLKKMKNDDGNKEVSDAVGILVSYWKSYSNSLIMYHGTLLNALSARNYQALAACKKAVKEAKKAEKPKKKEEKATTEGFINTEAFLGAVEFF